MIETSQGTYAIGGWDSLDRRNEVLELVCPRDQIQRCQWIEVGNLQLARSNFVSFALPESYGICGMIL